MINTMYLGYSKQMNKDITIEYEWDTYLCCDSEVVPMLKIKPTHKNVWRCYTCIKSSEEDILNKAIASLVSDYQVI